MRNKGIVLIIVGICVFLIIGMSLDNTQYQKYKLREQQYHQDEEARIKTYNR